MPRTKMDKEEILNQVKAACMSYPLRAMAADLGKPYSTLSNELDHRDYAKLGFLSTLSIIENSVASYAPDQSRTAALHAMDLIEAGLNRIAFEVPLTTHQPIPQTMRLMAALSKEYGETIATLADAIDDHKFTKEEIQQCIKETRDLLKVALQLDHHLHAISAGTANYA